MRLERDDHVVLLAELGRVVGAARAQDRGLALRNQAQPLGAHRVQMRAARDQAGLDDGSSQIRAEAASAPEVRRV